MKSQQVKNLPEILKQFKTAFLIRKMLEIFLCTNVQYKHQTVNTNQPSCPDDV